MTNNNLKVKPKKSGGKLAQMILYPDGTRGPKPPWGTAVPGHKKDEKYIFVGGRTGFKKV